MTDRGRIVVVAAGFALWAGGRCVAAARWSDIRRLHARRHAAPGDALALVVELVDGSRMELHEQAPGFDAFADRASVTLSGMVPVGDWHHAATAAGGGSGALLFDRSARRY
ncbi:MAG: hypothetical protein HOQ17_10105 [Gemmatimonadaceae bacterium]|nr:hypothetical protein [Gemmatimonadaceae bacterium]NUO92946.1 hypothetical protein [Gemmatimonadaceae bacterium]NUP56624.1 hypothetical protein [Gemmatimonadaceae bacterium]NUP71433.1 hypothetical protein [Gemmatimonadaceae bacterium]NUR35011.1 hypothetical protein [Gemmatimonadaceae bacterium]